MNMKTKTLLFPMPHRPWTQNDCIRKYFYKTCSLVLYILHICCYLPICTIVCCIFICFKGWAVLCVVYVLCSCMKSVSSWFCEFTSSLPSCRDGSIPCKQCEETNRKTQNATETFWPQFHQVLTSVLHLDTAFCMRLHMILTCLFSLSR